MANVTIAKPQIVHAGDLFNAFKGFSSVTVNMPPQVWLSSCKCGQPIWPCGKALGYSE